MDNSGDSGDDVVPLGTSGFLSGSGVSSAYIGVQSDDLEGNQQSSFSSPLELVYIRARKTKKTKRNGPANSTTRLFYLFFNGLLLDRADLHFVCSNIFEQMNA